jgi:hypothetical protein
MRSNITYQEYWNEVKSLAQTVLDKYHADEQPDGCFETVDSHQWVIYNAYHFDVLKHCADADAYFEMYGEAPTGDSTGEILGKFAFAALFHDVQTALQELCDETSTEVEE